MKEKLRKIKISKTQAKKFSKFYTFLLPLAWGGGGAKTILGGGHVI